MLALNKNIFCSARASSSRQSCVWRVERNLSPSTRSCTCLCPYLHQDDAQSRCVVCLLFCSSSRPHKPQVVVTLPLSNITCSHRELAWSVIFRSRCCSKMPINSSPFYLCTCGVLVIYFWCTCNLLLVYLWSTSGVLVIYFWCTCNLLLVYLWSTSGVLVIYFWCTCDLLLVYL